MSPVATHDSNELLWQCCCDSKNDHTEKPVGDLKFVDDGSGSVGKYITCKTNGEKTKYKV